MRSPCSEFPNDNPALHLGACWVTTRHGAGPRPVLRAPTAVVQPEVETAPVAAIDTAVEIAPVPPPETEVETALEEAVETTSVVALDAAVEPAPVVELDAPIEPVGDAATPPEMDSSPPQLSEDFERFIHAVAGVALERGATRVAAIIAGLLRDHEAPAHGLDDETRLGLERANIAELAGDSVRSSAAFRAQVGAWQAVLSGLVNELPDTDALDEWASQILSAALGSDAADGVKLRRALRRRGVAAFGLLAA